MSTYQQSSRCSRALHRAASVRPFRRGNSKLVCTIVAFDFVSSAKMFHVAGRSRCVPSGRGTNTPHTSIYEYLSQFRGDWDVLTVRR